MSMSNTEETINDIRCNTRRKFFTEEKVRIVLDGLRGESSIGELCRRAAQMARRIAGDLIDVTKLELDLLRRACEGHSDGHLEADVTIMTCWDADRLDLGRVGIRPDPARLCNDAGRHTELLSDA